MNHVAVPADLNGSLVAALLPLRSASVPAFDTKLAQTMGAANENPFLAARAELVAPRQGRARREMVLPRYDTWGTAVLLGTSQTRTSDEPVIFGRSASTLAEFQATDQPAHLPESTAASLWLVPGIGLVLGLERLTATHEVAEETDRLGRLLRRPVPGAERGDNPFYVPDAAQGVAEALQALGVTPQTRLPDLFPNEVDDLSDVLDLNRPIAELLVPSRTSRAGHQLIEGLVVGLGAAEDGSDLRIDSLIFRAIEGDEVTFEAGDQWQSEGYRWDFEPVQLVKEPARESALCAIRTDGRVAVVDLDALSIYHDYLGIGGDGIVRALIPLAAVTGQLAADQANVVDQLGRLAADGNVGDDVLATGLALVRRVRARLELRTLQQPHLLQEKNFRAWTNDESLRREMSPRAMRDQFTADGSAVSEQVDALRRSVSSLEDALQRRADERSVIAERRREEGQQRLRSAISLVSGVVTAAGLVAVFTSLASVPARTERAVSSLNTVGLLTLFSLALLALVAGFGFVLVEGTRALPGPRSRVAIGVLALAGATSGLALRTSPQTQAAVLMLGCVAVIMAGLLFVLDLRHQRLSEGSPA